jgi:hypothetical protein
VFGFLWLFGLNACRSFGVDGLDRDERHREQRADTRDIVGAGWAGQQAVVTDAVKPCGKTCIRKRLLRQSSRHVHPADGSSPQTLCGLSAGCSQKTSITVNAGQRAWPTATLMLAL